MQCSRAVRDNNGTGAWLPGYSVAGTLAHDLLMNPQEVRGLDGRPISVRCSTVSVSFAGERAWPGVAASQQRAHDDGTYLL